MPAKEGVAVAATATAVATPLLVVHWGGLGHAIFAQTLAVLLWGVAIAAWARFDTAVGVAWRALAPLLLALGLVAAGVVISAVMNRVPGGVWVGSLGVLAAAAAAAVAGARAAVKRPEHATRALMLGLVVAGVVSLVIAALQLAAPGWASAAWVAPVRTPGRASANLDQPNHLALLLLWAWLAVAAWTAGVPMRARPVAGTAGAAGTSGASGFSGFGASRISGYSGFGSSSAVAAMPASAAPAAVPVPGGWAFFFAFALQAGVVATASRAGLVAALVIALWAALDRRLPRPSAWLLWISALGGLVMTIGRAVMTPAMSLSTSASLVRPGARGGVFVDALQLIREHPWTGVGWMEFQLAWSLSPLGDRGPRYFDHAHNIVMNLLAELGVPLGLAICGCLIWGAVALLRSLARVPTALQPRARMLAAMLAVIGLASLFDAPLWYAHLLLPSAWAWGCLVALETTSGRRTAAAAAARSAAPPRQRDIGVQAGLAAAGLVLAAAAYATWVDFQRVSPSMLPRAAGAPARAAAGGSQLFAYYGDYQRVSGAGEAPPELFSRARWVWVDTGLLAGWIASLERAGRHDEARYLMQRALEFRDPAHTPWLAACRVVEPLEPPSRCLPPTRLPSWREFR
ncbi:MAG: O-antigen ligase family protein [Betaproteobacteria bacterium]|nr:O-antigen ligase family protein [Betaproteobacteria bacterium]MCC6249432.1 O-antigen ligase family protein [Rubrivivax sp.]